MRPYSNADREARGVRFGARASPVRVARGMPTESEKGQPIARVISYTTELPRTARMVGARDLDKHVEIRLFTTTSQRYYWKSVRKALAACAGTPLPVATGVLMYTTPAPYGR